MKVMISGHRKSKLANYDIDWIKEQIESVVLAWKADGVHVIGLSGMADGIDLIFCQILLDASFGYHAYIPFHEQDEYMSKEDKKWRRDLINKAYMEMYGVRNSTMIDNCDEAIVVWDGNKGGTHNCFQQLIECGKEFVWIEPQNKRRIYVFGEGY